MDRIIAANGIFFERNVTDRPSPNDNIVVVGASGKGKTTGFVEPNIREGGSGSMVISDPKGGLYERLHEELEHKGYEVLLYDLMNPERSDAFNFFHYMDSESDIQNFAHTITYPKGEVSGHYDPYWDMSTESLMIACVEYMLCQEPRHKWNIRTLMDILTHWTFTSTKSHIQEDLLISEAEEAVQSHPEYSLVDRLSIYVNTPEKTRNTIISTTFSKIQSLTTSELNNLFDTKMRKAIEIEQIGRKKTAVFVVVPDTDRSKDVLASLFFTLCFQKLCQEADARPDRRLAVNVRFFLDDFASSVVIPNFPDYTSTIRSRGISAAIILQSISQLKSRYQKEDATIILDNCDTEIYLGSNSIESADYFAKRTGISSSKILSLPYGKCIVIRSGEAHPYVADVIKPNAYCKEEQHEQALQRGA